MQVQRGDIGIVLQDPGKKIKDTDLPFEGDHTFLIAEGGELKRTTKTVHLTWGGLYTLDFEDHILDTIRYILRCLQEPISSEAVRYAEGWLREVPGIAKSKSPHMRSTYDQQRAKAVMHDVGQLGNLPYEFDALRRSLKWHSRMQSPFSNNKGLTCAAWVVACYQAAAFNSPTIEVGALKACRHLIEGSRSPKLKPDARLELPHVKAMTGTKDANYREIKNLGADPNKTPNAMKQALHLLKKDKAETDDALLNRLLTKALVVDARFLHTDGLVRRVKDDSQNWRVFKRIDGQDALHWQ
jgi:hypothetical protein